MNVDDEEFFAAYEDVGLIENRGPQGPTSILYGPPYFPWPLSPLERLLEIRNPRDLTARVIVHIGNDARVHVALERKRPDGDRMSDAEMAKRLRRLLPIRTDYLNVELVLPPGGTLEVPSGWLPALRKVQGGFVVGGLMHFLEIVGEQNPPKLSAAFIDDPPLPSAIRRRRK